MHCNSFSRGLLQPQQDDDRVLDNAQNHVAQVNVPAASRVLDPPVMSCLIVEVQDRFKTSSC